MHVAEGLVSTLKVAIATPSLVRHEAKDITKIHFGLLEYSWVGRSKVLYAYIPYIDLEGSMCMLLRV